MAEGFRPLTAQKRGAQIPLAEPTVEIDPRTIPMEITSNDFDSSRISQTKVTEVRVATLTLIQTADAPSNTRERGGVVHVAVTAPAGVDSSRSMEYDKQRVHMACRFRLKLPATCHMIQRQPPLSLILCQTRACQAAIPTEQDPVKSTVNSDDSDHA